MSKIAYCGIDCSKCLALIATIENSDQKRKEVATQWSSQEFQLNPEDINCLGCTSNESAWIYCSTCDIRTCAREKQLVNCAFCTDFPCDKLNKIWKMAPTAKDTLFEIKNKHAN
jgi:hypothetical protein